MGLLTHRVIHQTTKRTSRVMLPQLLLLPVICGPLPPEGSVIPLVGLVQPLRSTRHVLPLLLPCIKHARRFSAGNVFQRLLAVW